MRAISTCSRIGIGLLLAVLALLTVLPVAAASVTTRYPVATSFGSDGTSATSFGDPESLAFNQNSDRLYVLDKGDSKIHAFDAPSLAPSGGAFPLTAPDANSGALSIAVDNTFGASAGNIYYTQSYPSSLLYGFSSAGAALGGNFPVGPLDVPTGSAVDSAGNIWVSEYGQSGSGSESSHRILKFGPNGDQLSAVSTSQQGQPGRIAVSSDGDLFVAMWQGPVWKYTAASGYTSATKIDSAVARAVAVDNTAHVLYVAHRSDVYAYDTTTGAFLYDFASHISGSDFEGIAVDEGADSVYVSDTGNDKVHAFGPATSFPDPAGTPTAATNVSYFSADIGGTVDDNSAVPTNWRLELSGDGGTTWSKVSSGETAGGQSGVAVSGTATELLLNHHYQFRVVTNKGVNGVNDVDSNQLSFTTLNHPDATATPTAPTNITGASADLHASIDDNGPLPTNWRIELTADGGTTWSEVDSGQTAGEQSGVAVTASATELIPNSDYSFRVITNKGPGSPEVNGGSLDFSTAAVPPAIADAEVGAIEVDDTSARLVATINPRHSATSYVFSYGLTAAADEVTTNPVDIGAGLEGVTDSQLITGLEPDTDYYFKATATNPAGTTTSATVSFHTRAVPFPDDHPSGCPNEAIREEQGSTWLPECRAFEMVSPPDKNQGTAGGRGHQGGEPVSATISEDGNGVAFCTASLFGEPAGQLSNTCAHYISRRGPGGWNTVNPLPKFCASDTGTGDGGIFQGSRNVLVAPRDFSRYAMATPEFADCPFFPLVPGAPADSNNLYRGDLGSSPTSFDLLTPNKSAGIGQNQIYPMGGSKDLSHVVFASLGDETSDSPPQDSSYYKLYDWAEGGAPGCDSTSPAYEPTLAGCLRLVGKDASGAAFAGNTQLPAYDLGAAHSAIPSAVSEDGGRIYFQSPTGLGGSFGAGTCETSSCDLFMREGGTTTYDISASECSGSCIDSGADNFEWATPAGDKALFVSCAQLTDASSPGNGGSCGGDPTAGQDLKLYRWDESAPAGHRLIDLTVDHEAADGSQPQALDVIGASTEESADPASNAAPGNTVYFVAAGQIVAGEPAPAPNGTEPANLKLYRWTYDDGSPSVAYLGPYLSYDESGSVLSADRPSLADSNLNRNHIRVTPDGKYLAIQTKLALDPAADRDSDADMYRWDEKDGWVCVSCQLPGTPSMGNVSTYTPFLYYNALFGDMGLTVPEHRISDDGQRIFFSTPDALVARDTDGEAGCPEAGEAATGFANSAIYECQDVYEWHDGTLSLLTPGTGNRPFVLIGASADGKNVFVSTAQRLVGWDLDTQVDIYDVRAAGGFPEPPPAEAGCSSAESCHGAPSSAPSSPGAGSAAFQGPGDPAPKFKTAKKKRHRGRTHHRRNKHKHQRKRSVKRKGGMGR